MNLAKLSVLTIGLLSSVAAFAGTPILSENFNVGFHSGTISPGDTSDNWAHTGYGAVVNANGWTFGNSAYFATDGAGNGAILLNENGVGQASKLVTGLVAGQSYTLQFNMWGDNIVGGMYGLDVAIGGKHWGYDDVVHPAGYYQGSGGHLKTIVFTASADSALLSFEQVNFGAAASPIIDNVSVTAAVPEPETYAMLLGGLALMGVAARRKAKRQQA